MKILLAVTLTFLIAPHLPSAKARDTYAYAFGEVAFNGLDEETAPITDVSKVAAGTDHSLILKTDGTLWSAGGNQFGQLGDGTINPRSYPQQIASGVIDIAAGHHTSLWVKGDGSLWTCGANENNQIGGNNSTGRWRPQSVAIEVKAVFAGQTHNLYLKNDDTLHAFGMSSQSTQVATDVRTAAAGAFHTLFVKNDNTLWGIGFDSNGKRIVTNFIQNNAPRQLASQVSLVVAGDEHSLILKENGSLWAEGLNRHGEIGTGNTTPVLLYQKIEDNVATLSAYQNSSAYITTSGTSYTMGKPVASSQASSNILTPQQIAKDQSSIDLGATHVLQIGVNQQLSSLGNNEVGQLASESPPAPGSFKLIGKNLNSMSLGDGHALIVDGDGNLWGAGSNQYGALGDGSQIDRTNFVLIDSKVTRASAGNSYSLYLKEDGTLWGMGANWYNNLGAAVSNPQLTPVQIAADVTLFVAEFEKSYFVTSDGNLWGLGANIIGRDYLGNSSDSPTPTKILEDVIAIDAEGKLALFLTSDGTVWGIGQDRYRYGIPNNSQQGNLYPVFSGASNVSVGQIHALYLKENGELWGGGANDYGQLGLGYGSSNDQVLISKDVVAAEARGSSTLFLKSNGTLWGLGAGIGELSVPLKSDPARSKTMLAAGVVSFSGGGSALLFQSTASHNTDEDLDGHLALYDPNDTNPHNPLEDENSDYVPDTYIGEYPAHNYAPSIKAFRSTNQHRFIETPVAPGYIYYLQSSKDLQTWTIIPEETFQPFTVDAPQTLFEIELPDPPSFYRIVSKLR